MPPDLRPGVPYALAAPTRQSLRTQAVARAKNRNNHGETIMRSIIVRFSTVTALFLASTLALADDAPPYSEGPVTEVTYIKVKSGMFEDYMKWLATDRKRLMDEYKKAGIILDSKVYGAAARSPSEPDLILTVTYKNLAAMDNLEERTRAIDEKVVGSTKTANEGAISRDKMREVLGSEIIRELILK